MKLIANILGLKRKNHRITLADQKEEIFLRQSREQFKKLVDRGLAVPVAYL